MTLNVQVYNSLDQINNYDYAALMQRCGASIFYDHRFLYATERAHLLPIEKTYYLVAYQNEAMVAFMPTYLQSSADPFGVLSKTTSMIFDNSGALLSHIMHCYESMVLADGDNSELYELMLRELKLLAIKEGVKYYGILNVIDKKLMTVASHLNFNVNYMWDRYYVDFTQTKDFETFLSELNREGRQSFRRQLRKFEENGGEFVMEAPPLNNIEEVAELCHLTTKKHGTAHYYPEESFINFVKTCDGMVRILSIYYESKRVAAGVCFVEKDKLHLWACGMIYDDVPFSPYIIAIASAFKYAFENDINIVEIGRTNGKIKEKLGFSPLPLFSIVSNDTTEDI